MGNFTVINENYEFKDGEILTMFKIDETGKEYVLSSLKNNYDNSCNLVVSYIDKDLEGHDILKDIVDVEERKQVTCAVKRMIEGENK